MIKRRVQIAALIGLFGLTTVIDQAALGQAPQPTVHSSFVSIKAYNLPNGYVRHANGVGRVNDIFSSSSDLAKADATWAIVSGLAGSCVSLESRNYRGYFLRHQNGAVFLQLRQDSAQFRQDATFCQVNGLADSSASSFRAFQFPNAYLRHASGVLHLADSDGSDLFRHDATFTTASPWLTGRFFNPILGRGADPTMAYHNGHYYLVQGDVLNQDNIVVRRSPSVEQLEDAAPITVWSHPSCPAPACSAIWAPELQRIDGVWWIYFAGENGNGNASHRMYALRGTTDDPAGPYEFQGMVQLPGSEWAIDGVYFAYQGQGYFLWSGWLNGDPKVQHLFVAPMSGPMTPAGGRVRISTPVAGWETVRNDFGVRVNEAPQPIEGPNGRLSVTFSANGSWTNDYCLGLLRLSGAPLDPAAWTKSSGCVFSGRETAVAPGHNGFLTIQGQPWLAYHALIVPGTGWPGRSLRLQPMGFSADGSPALGAPVGIHQPVPLP